MKKTIPLAVIVCVLTLFMPLQAQWAKIYGDDASDEVLSVQQTSDGGYVVAGEGVYGGGRFLVVKLDAAGNLEWESAHSNSWFKAPISLQQTADGGYVYACHGGRYDAYDSFIWKDEILIIKLLSDGSYNGINSFSRFINNSEYARVFQPTGDGGYVLGGDTQTYGVGQDNIWMAKLSSAGDLEWQYAYGGISNNSIRSIQQTGDGGYVLGGTTNSFGAGGLDIWILKLSASGDIEWQKAYGGSGDDSSCFVKQTGDGGYVAAGDTQSFGSGDRDIWILKLSSSGDVEWQVAYGGSSSDRTCSVRQTGDGGFVVGGTTQSFGNGADDFWLMKLSSTGSVEWQKTFGTSSSETCHALDRTDDGGCVAAGSVSSYGSGSSDFLVVRLLSDGTLGSPCRFFQDSAAQVSLTGISPANTDVTPIFSNVVRDMVDISVTESDVDIAEYEFCSANPLLAIHADSGGTTSPPPGTSSRVFGENVTLTAFPQYGIFSGWSGDVSDDSDQITVTMIEDTSVTAHFTFLEYTLTIQSGEGGTTIPEPGAYDYFAGSNIPVTAVPEIGYRFSEWSGDASGEFNPVKVYMDADKSVTASFVQVSGGEDGGETALDKIFRFECFIASAAYGSQEHPYVEVLRDFRDEYLMQSEFGRKLVALYYRHSPQIAAFISKNKPLKFMVRLHLMPLVAFSYMMVHLGSVATAVFGILIFTSPFFWGIIYHRKRQKQFKRTS